jgi:hypothetical protein
VAALCFRSLGVVVKSRKMEIEEIESLREAIEKRADEMLTPRWNPNPEEVQRSVLKLVLTLVEFLRKLLERQAIRRMENGTLTSDETEAIGLAIMRLEQTIHELASRFDLSPEDLNMDLGPLGRLI